MSRANEEYYTKFLAAKNAMLNGLHGLTLSKKEAAFYKKLLDTTKHLVDIAAIGGPDE